MIEEETIDDIDYEPNNPMNTQVGGDHYSKMKIQPTEFILANDIPFCEGNVIKYISRWKSKNGIEDLKKVIHYAEILIANEEKDMNFDKR